MKISPYRELGTTYYTCSGRFLDDQLYVWRSYDISRDVNGGWMITHSWGSSRMTGFPNFPTRKAAIEFLAARENPADAKLSQAQKRTRDSQRSRLYTAENEAMPRDDLNGRTPEEYVRTIEDSELWRELVGEWANKPITVTRGGSTTSCAWLQRWALRFAPGRFHQSREIVIHEMAHLATYRIHGSKVAAHGPEFAGILLLMVQYEMGEYFASRLRASFAKHNVKVVDPGRKVVYA